MKRNILLYFSVFLVTISCKKENKTTQNNNPILVNDTITNRTNKNTLVKKNEGDYLYKAIINSKTGTVLKDTINETKLGAIPFGAEVLVTKFRDFETMNVMNRVNVYGQWVEVVYQDKNEYVKGRIFDGYLDYKYYTKESNIYTDTVVVKNEQEFFKALRSNRTIIVDAKEINLDKGKEIIESIEDEEGSHLIYYADDFAETLVFSNFLDLEIKGKNLVDFFTEKQEANVIEFKNSSNIYIDNINFYHKNVSSCGGDVLSFSNCDNFYFQNSSFDGSGLTAIHASESESLNFFNCDFYNNHSYIIRSHDTKYINLKRCDIYGNELSEAMFDASGFDYETYVDCINQINISECYITDNETSSLIESDGKQDNIFNIDNSLITNNNFEDDIINLISNSKVKIKSTDFINNRSISNKYIIDKDEDSDYKEIEISLEEVSFKDNIDFYDFNKGNTAFTKKENVIVDNRYNKETDTLLTHFNRTSIAGLNYIERSDKDIKYNKKTNEFSVNGHLLKGLHKLNFSDRNDFYIFLDEKSSSVENYSGYGEIIDGKLEGEWKIECAAYQDIVEYKNGIIQKMRREVIVNYKPKEITVVKKGIYIDGQKNGVFEYFYEDGNLRKKLTFKDNKLDYPREFYFPNGKMRFIRTKNKSIHYHPNGIVIAVITYDEEGKFVINESNYYDSEGNLKEAKETPKNSVKFYIEGGVSIIFKGIEEHKDKVFVSQNYNIAEFLHFNNSIARYKVSNSDFLNKSIDLKVGHSDYAESYRYNNKKLVYIFDKLHNLRYKAVIENGTNLNLYVYNDYNYLKKVFKQYIYTNKHFVLNGDVSYYSNGYMSYAKKYENGKVIN
ncbi:right-handed parallel beta-helix repeat-containing protein [Cellulophaga sp. Asnod2-G02]|uniref:right-handed parallel beta-helix repeat-containing protein n=1 Tax=Cellulophaga sp. Asnod2-G02 TaxID=3160572 RepID=UPI00386A15C7